MGFFDAFKKLVMGKPVFEVSKEYNDTEKEWSDELVAEPVIAQQQGLKVIPEVIINEYHTRMNGSNMTCQFVIHNKSEQYILVEKVLMLGQHKDIDDHLRAGEERSFVVYSGARPTNNHYDELKVQYKNESGDYFMTVHHLEFQKQADGTYIINRIKFVPPVRDI